MFAQTQTNSNKPKVLIVDDDPQNIYILLEILKSDYAIVAAKNGTKALEFATQTPHPDLIILDVMMPDVDGYTLCQTIKSHPKTQDIPIIFLSALDTTLDKVKAFDAGGVDYITKPFQREEVLARVASHIEIYQLRQQLYQKTEQLAEKNEELLRVNQDLKERYSEIKATQLQLVQAEKMASLGGLTAGIAHEINNPTGFIKANIEPAKTYCQDLFGLVDFLLQTDSRNTCEIQNKIEAVDLPFIREDLPKIINSISLGADRISKISHSLRIFSRTDQTRKVAFKLHDGLNSTLFILKHRTQANEYRPAIEITKDYGYLPEIYCFPGQLNQVFMNLLANAIDAFDEANKGKSFAQIKTNPNRIIIETKMLENEQIQVRIQDNGCGMKPETQAKIFDQGFTTKVVGKGTGLGLAIARQIVVEKHQGSLNVWSEPGQGTEFCMSFPIGKS